MSSIPIIFGMLCLLSVLRPNFGLTGTETGYFESEEIEVIAHLPGVWGRITIRGFGSDSFELQSNGIPDHAVTQDSQERVSEQDFVMRFLQDPVVTSEPSCLPANSIVGIATNGVAILSPFDYNSNDVNANVGSSCQALIMHTHSGGFPGGFYYYAQVPDKCNTYLDGFRGHDASQIYGVALDGFPIYGPGNGINKPKVTNAELDACHGKFVNGEYRYYMTHEWPYVLGCFRGVPGTIQGGPTGGECKYACNTDSLVNNVPCANDFAMRPITMKPTTIQSTKRPTVKPSPTSVLSTTMTTPKVITVPSLVTGITNEEAAAFSSQDDQIEQNTMLKGYTEMTINPDDTFTLISNGIPDHATAPYPNDDNPYELLQQDFELTIPRYPEYNDEPTCLPSPGIIGFATNGVPLFSPYDAIGQDVNTNATFDVCQGRTSALGIYQYSQPPNKFCAYRNTNENEIYGVSIDGFPIYGPGDPPVENADLDICHGRFVDGQYRYYMTTKFPYFLGCFRATPQKLKKVPTFDESNCLFSCNTDDETSADEKMYCDNGGVSIFCYTLISILMPMGVLFAFYM